MFIKKGSVLYETEKINLHLNKETIVMFIIGCLVLVISIVFFNKLYYNSVVISPIEKWAGLAGLAIGSFLGFVMIFVSVTKNLKSMNRFYVFCVISIAVLIVSSVLFEAVRAVIILIAVDFLVYAVATLFKNLVVTILTLTLYTYLGVILLTFVVNNFVDAYWVAYVGLCAIFVSYRYLALPINKYLIKRYWGEEDSEKYDKEQLIGQLKLYYLAFWAVINITGSIYNSENTMIYNNIFLTVVLFIDVDFKKMIGYKRNTA